MKLAPPLPIDAVLDELRDALAAGTSAVLVAPPGAGKTTRVPLALLAEGWLGRAKILVLEPRRIAARAAAERMARSLSEAVGERVGLRARMATRSGPRTRIEVITEGVFTRMILDDPELAGIGAVLFDEFHERSLDADLGLALALDCQRGFRADLRILAMSATLDDARVAQVLGGAPVIASEGRAFPVETRYLGRDAHARIEDQVADAVMRALREEAGSILTFLPGQAEIRRVEERLNERLDDPAVVLAPLYGAMDMKAQDLALQPAPGGVRKVVLATSLAETSITIEGVRVVIDCGLARVPRFEPDVGVTRLETVRVSRAGADQRRGRAGRTGPGVCYRLWDERQTQSLAAFAEPEIRAADLAGLLLDCADWGATDPRSLVVDRSAAGRRHRRRARGADTAGGARRRRPHHGRRAAAQVAAAAAAAGAHGDRRGRARPRAGGRRDRRGDRGARARRQRSRPRRSAGPVPPRPLAPRRRHAPGWRRAGREWRACRATAAGAGAAAEAMSTARLLALAYPERIGKARGAPGQFLLANGRGAYLDATHPLARSPFLVAAELSGAAASTRILLAAAADEADVVAAAGHRIRETDEIELDASAAALRSRRVRRLDAIVLAAAPRAVEPSEETARLLAEGIARLGVSRLPWSKAQLQLRDRVGFLRGAAGGPGRAPRGERWPDLTDAALAADGRGVAGAVPRRQDAARRDRRRRPRRGARCAAAVAPEAAPRRGGADAFRGAHGQPPRHRLRGSRRPRAAHPRAGAVRARRSTPRSPTAGCR